MTTSATESLLSEVREARRLLPPAEAKALRVAAGVSQERVASVLGVHRITVVRWESGAFEPRGEVRLQYVALLDALQTVINERD